MSLSEFPVAQPPGYLEVSQFDVDGSSPGGQYSYRQGSVALIAGAEEMSSPDVDAAQKWAQQFPQSSGVSVSFPEVSLALAEPELELLPTTAEQLGAVQLFFGLSKSQLAKICLVQRQTIYDWYAGRFEATDGNAVRVQELYELANELRERQLGPLSAKVAQRRKADGGTLEALLSAKKIDAAAVRRMTVQLGEATQAQRQRGAKALRQRLGWPGASEEARRANLSSNLDDLEP